MKHHPLLADPGGPALPTDFRGAGGALTRRSFLGVSVGALLSGSALAADEELIERLDSKYNTILVYRRGDYVTLTFGYNRRIYTESVANTKDELELPVSYTQYMTVALAYTSNIDSMLEIGFGGGRTAWYLQQYFPDIPVTSVELDGKVVEIAKKYFGVYPHDKFHIKEKDGRIFLVQNKEKYDVILLDAYRGPFVPFHLMTEEFYRLVRSRLREGGVIAQNVEPSTMLFDASVATLRSVFDQVDFFPAGGNVVSVAYDGPRRDADSLQARATALQQSHGFRYQLPRLVQGRRQLGEPVAREPLTDDFAPVETLRAIEKHNEKWL